MGGKKLASKRRDLLEGFESENEGGGQIQTRWKVTLSAPKPLLLLFPCLESVRSKEKV